MQDNFISLQSQAIQKILVCQLRQIGDVLLATPSVELLHRRFPQAQVHFFTEKKCAPLLENNPHISQVWALDKSSLPTLLHELVYYWQVAGTRFDLLVDFQQLPRCRWVTAFSRAEYRLSYTPPWYNRFLYTHWTSQQPRYAAAFKAMILEPLGINWNGEKPRIYLRDEERIKAASLLRDWGVLECRDQPFITVDISHRHPTRRWPALYYAQLIKNFARKFPFLKFLLLYGPGEREEVEALHRVCGEAASTFVPPQMLDLRELAACMSFASMHIGNCSAPRHIAVAVDLPSVTLMGATSSGWTFPSAQHIELRAHLPCQPCNKNACASLDCLRQLDPERATQQSLAHFECFAFSHRGDCLSFNFPGKN